MSRGVRATSGRKRRHRHGTRSTSFALYVARLLLITCFCVYAAYLAVQFLLQPRYLFADQLFLVLLLFVLGIQMGRRIRLFLIDWLPFIVFVMLYQMMRSFAPRLYSRVHVTEPYEWELTTFGWMANGGIPAFGLRAWQAAHAGETLTNATDVILGIAYSAFFVIPIVLMAIFWWRLKDRRLFWRFSCTLSLVSYMALATFVLYPAAPPWYYQKFGAIQPTETAYGQAAAGGLVHLDAMLNRGLFATVWGSFNPNYFAAVPSLHAAWPVAVAMFTLMAFGRKAWPIVLYPALVIVGGVYFNHHYIIDYVIAWAYLLVAFVVIERAVMPRLDRVMDYTLLWANSIPSGSISTAARRRGPAKSVRGESSGKYLFRTTVFAKGLQTIRSTWEAVNTGPFGEMKAIKYFAIFITICISLGFLSYSLFFAPGNAETLYNQGVYLDQQGQHEEAIAEYDEAIHLDPQYVDAYNNRGIAHQKLGQYERAIQDYGEAIRFHPQSSLAYNNRGNVYYTLGQLRRAIQDYDEAIRLDPRVARGYGNRGNAYLSLDQYQRAIKEYDEAIRLDPQLAGAYANRGVAYTLIGNDVEARQDIERAVELGFDHSKLETTIKGAKKSRR